MERVPTASLLELKNRAKFLVTKPEWDAVAEAWLKDGKIYEIEARYREFLTSASAVPGNVNLNKYLNSLIPGTRISFTTYSRILKVLRKTANTISKTNGTNVVETATYDTVKRYNDKESTIVQYREFSNITTLVGNISDQGDFVQTSQNTGKNFYQKKSYAGDLSSEYGFALSRAEEEIVNKLPDTAEADDIIRKRERHSFVFENYRADLTMVTVNKACDKVIMDNYPNDVAGAKEIIKNQLVGVTNLEDQSIYWQFEVECIDVSKWKEFYTAVLGWLKIVQDTKILYKLSNKYFVINDCSRILQQLYHITPIESKNELRINLLVQPRNLRLSEVTYGQIAGGDIEYMVTPKADGERKILYVHRQYGMWLLAPPMHARKILERGVTDQINEFLDLYHETILDGELIPEENWRIPQGTPDLLPPSLMTLPAKTDVLSRPPEPKLDWFLVFDCINSSLSAASNSNTVKLPLDKRINFANDIVTKYKQLSTVTATKNKEPARVINFGLNCQINMKAYYQLTFLKPIKQADGYPIFANNDPAASFFITMRFVMSQLDGVLIDNKLTQYLPYKTDGLIFTPIAEYKPNLDKLPLTERQLPKVADALKWKPATNEYTIDFAVNGNALEVTDNKQYKIFAHLDNATMSDPILQNLAPRAVVEFEVLINKDVVVGYKPKRIRWGKKYPNSLEVAKDNIAHARFPIVADTLMGTNAKLMSEYQNKIKRELLRDAMSEVVKSGVASKGKIVALEIGAGYGQNLFKLANCDLIYAVEPDSTNFAELQRRVSELAKEDPIWEKKVVLINSPAEVPLDIIPNNSVDIVSLMLCLTFFWEPNQSPVKLEGLLQNIDRVLKVGGKICLLTMDGNAVEEYLGVDGLLSVYPNPKAPPDSQPRVFEGYFGNVVMKIQMNGAIHIKIPGTIVDQTEALVYLQDIQKLRPEKYLINKKGRADQEFLLPEAQYQFSRMYNYAQLTQRAKDQYIRGITFTNTTLTKPQLVESISYTADPSAIPVMESNNETLAPLKVIPPLTDTGEAQGDNFVQLISTNLYYPTYTLATLINLIGGVEPNIDPSQDVVLPIISLDNYLGGRKLARIAVIDDPAGIFSFYHALLKSSFLDYQNTKVYIHRVEMATLAYNNFVKFIKSDAYAQYAPYVAMSGLYGWYQQSIAPIPENGYDKNKILEWAEGPFYYPLITLVSALFKIHITIWIITPDGSVIPLASTKADSAENIGAYPNGICLLAHYSEQRMAGGEAAQEKFGGAGFGLQYELLAVVNEDGNKQTLFNTADPMITGLANDLQSIWGVSNRIIELFGQNLNANQIMAQVKSEI